MQYARSNEFVIRKVLVSTRRDARRWELEKWIVAVRKPRNFLARIPFTGNTYNEKLLYTVLISTMNAQRRGADVKSVKTRDSLINSVSRINRCSVQTTLSVLNKIPLLKIARKADCSTFATFFSTPSMSHMCVLLNLQSVSTFKFGYVSRHTFRPEYVPFDAREHYSFLFNIW